MKLCTHGAELHENWHINLSPGAHEKNDTSMAVQVRCACKHCTSEYDSYRSADEAENPDLNDEINKRHLMKQQHVQNSIAFSCVDNDLCFLLCICVNT